MNDSYYSRLTNDCNLGDRIVTNISSNNHSLLQMALCYTIIIKWVYKMFYDYKIPDVEWNQQRFIILALLYH